MRAPLQRLVELQEASTEAKGEHDAGPPAMVVALQQTPAAERPRRLQGFVQQQLAKVMGLADPQQIDPTEPLFNMGLDSLMALELTVLLETHLGVRLTESLVFEHPTVDDLVRHFLADVLFVDEAPGPLSSPAETQPSEGTSPASSADPGRADASATTWDQQVADVAALETADLLRQLRGE